MARTLLFLPYSPWSQKAKWALDHHGVDYRRKIYLPSLGEPMLRLKLRRLRGPVSVPILFDEDAVLEDSWDIARRAEELGEGEPLFFDLDAARHWNEVSERALAVGRRRSIDATLKDPEAQAEALTGIVPDPLRRPLRAIAVVAAYQLRMKYDAPDPRALEQSLDALREALGDGEHVLDRFSYADIAMAAVLEFVSPGSHVRRGEAEIRTWSDARLARRYADLLEWRDWIVKTRWPR